ncbi:hypothetical protein ACNKHQ_21055 [Shigella flexneri]
MRHSFPTFRLPDTLHLESISDRAGRQPRYSGGGVQATCFADVLRQMKPLLRPDARLLWATKGLEAETGRLFAERGA